MKSLQYILLISFLAVAFVACEKQADNNTRYTALTDKSMMVKFIHAYPYATPSQASPFNGPTVQFAVNGLQVSGGPIALGSGYPSGPDYARFEALPTFSMDIRMSTGVPPALVRDSALFNYSSGFQGGKYFSVFFADSIPVTSRRLLVVEDEIKPASANNLYRIRFVNLLANMPAATASLDLYSFRMKGWIFTAIPARGVTPFIELPVFGTTSAIPDTFQIRYTGVTGAALATLNTVTLIPGGSLTVFARGHVTSIGTRAPGISTYRNR